MIRFILQTLKTTLKIGFIRFVLPIFSLMIKNCSFKNIFLSLINHRTEAEVCFKENFAQLNKSLRK